MRAILFLLARLWRGSPIAGVVPGPSARLLFGAALAAIVLLMIIRFLT